MRKLIYLLTFYSYKDYLYWGSEDEDSSDSEDIDLPREIDPQHSPQRLEKFIHNNREEAHKGLARLIGLDYDAIKKFMRRVDEYRGRSPSRKRCRRSGSRVDDAKFKSARVHEPILMELLAAAESDRDPSDSLHSDRVMWDFDRSASMASAI